jgi:uncharacterized protein YndB with AHSA1/START domain
MGVAMTGLLATAEIDIEATRETVWSLLTSTGSHPEIMFGAEVVSDWNVGDDIRWRGEWNGSTFEDKGKVLEFEPPRRLVVTHFSPMSGQPDAPENYHELVYTLTETPKGTHLELSQDNNPDQNAAQHSSDNWRAMLEGVKAVAERG